MTLTHNIKKTAIGVGDRKVDMLLAIEPIAIVVSEIDPFFFKGSTRNKPSFYDFLRLLIAVK